MNPVHKNAMPIIRPLSSGLKKIAIEELNEDPDRVEEDVLTIRYWIHKQPHLRARTNDQFLLAFLRGSKFSLERAKQKLDRYYTLRAALPEIFNERRHVDDPIVQEILNLGVILRVPLPEDETGPCITIIRAGSYDINKFKFGDIIRLGSMFGEMMMIDDDNSNVSGYVEIMDMTGVSGTHFFALQPDLLRKFSVFADEAMPMRQRGTHFINVPPPFEKGFNTLKTLFPAKMKSRITVSSDPEHVFDYVPRKYLPKEYGGDNGTMEDIIQTMKVKLEKYRDYFAEEPKYGADEKLRENDLRFCYENTFGAEGSFRKLSID